jgi:hypothetical protein
MHMVNELCRQTERPLLVDMATTSVVSRAPAVFSPAPAKHHTWRCWALHQ